jgi:hypothetical protein
VTNMPLGRQQAPNPACFLVWSVETPYDSLEKGTADRKECLWLCGFGMSEKANAAL